MVVYWITYCLILNMSLPFMLNLHICPAESHTYILFLT